MIVTKLNRDEHGVWTARITPEGGETLPVTRRFGSWGTVPDDAGCWSDLPRDWCAALQERVRPLERRERSKAQNGRAA